jgi:hypothetical protein
VGEGATNYGREKVKGEDESKKKEQILEGKIKKYKKKINLMTNIKTSGDTIGGILLSIDD